MAEKRTAKLTDALARGLKPGAEQYVVWDKKVPGLGVRVGKNGSSFILKYRVGATQRKPTLGKVGVLSFDAAKKKAKEILVAAGNGIDVQDDRQRKRQSPTVEKAMAEWFAALPQAGGDRREEAAHPRRLHPTGAPGHSADHRRHANRRCGEGRRAPRHRQGGRRRNSKEQGEGVCLVVPIVVRRRRGRGQLSPRGLEPMPDPQAQRRRNNARTR